MNLVICSSCNKPLEKVPLWLATTNIDFVCTNCPNRTVKAITQVVLETPREDEPNELDLSAEDSEEED